MLSTSLLCRLLLSSDDNVTVCLIVVSFVSICRLLFRKGLGRQALLHLFPRVSDVGRFRRCIRFPWLGDGSHWTEGYRRIGDKADERVVSKYEKRRMPTRRKAGTKVPSGGLRIEASRRTCRRGSMGGSYVSSRIASGSRSMCS